MPWQKAAKAAQIKPIFGCEFYIVDDATARIKVQESLGASAFPHVTVLARTQRGYENLLKLSRRSWQEGFYYKPRIDWHWLRQHQDGLIVMSGCPGGYPTRLILGKGIEAAHEFVLQVSQDIEYFFVEIVPEPGFENAEKATAGLVRIAAELKLPLVMNSDAHFPRPQDWLAQDIMLAVGLGKRVNATDRPLKMPAYQFLCDEHELTRRAWEMQTGVPDEWFQYALANTDYIASLCDVEIPRAKPVIYAGLVPGKSSADQLWEDVVAGLYRRYEQGKIPLDRWDQYALRVQREWETIKRKGFCDYILAIADVVRRVKEEDGLVMLRGSAGGCLMLWALGASETDSILHDLSFERFYDDNRPDPPDVDVDFERARRDSAIQYVYSRYGAENCSQIAALSQLKAKAALQDVAFAYGIPRAEFAPLSAALDPKDEDVDAQLNTVTDPQALAVLEKHPELRILQALVGQYRQSSIHAAGVLVSSEPLDKVIGVVLGQNKQPVAAVDKKGAADLGFLKIDFLAVNGLDVVAATVRKIGKPMSWLYDLPLDDTTALKVGQAGLLAGVFQLDGGAAARVSREIGLTSFADVCAAGALCRPGPADWVPIYKTNKTNPVAFQNYLASMHPTVAAIVRDTYGILIYQEQVMSLARELAGFEWPEVHKLRKGITDKTGLDPQKGPAWREEWGTKFAQGCRARGVSEREIGQLWNAIQTHGGYSFNKAHCYTYGIVGYWMLYLKAHYPAEFYEAYLSLEGDEITVKKLLREFTLMGGEVKLLDPRYSRATFYSPRPGLIVGGWSNIKGIGPKTAEKLDHGGPYEDWEALYYAMGKAMGARLRDAGFHLERWNTQRVLSLASWYPVQHTSEEEENIRQAYGFNSLSVLDRGIEKQEVTVVGYVTAVNVEAHKALVVLEDENATVLGRVPARLLKALSPKFKELQVSDYVVTTGWWNGEAFYIRDVVLAKRLSHVASASNGANGVASKGPNGAN